MNACGATCQAQCDSSLVPSVGECITIGGPIECNPVSNEGCNGAGEACDYGPGGFSCYPSPNEQEICEECQAGGPSCQARSTCTADAVCAKFCCTDADCGGTGNCLIGAFNVGHCVKGSGGPAGSGGNQGSGGSPNGSGGSPNGSGGSPNGSGGNPGGNGGNGVGGVGGAGGAGGN